MGPSTNLQRIAYLKAFWNLHTLVPHQTRTGRDHNLYCAPRCPFPPHIESRRSSRPIKSPSYPFSSFPRCIYHLRTTLNSLFAFPGSSSWTTMGFEELVSRVESLTRTYDGRDCGVVDERGTEPMPVCLFAARSSASCFRLRSYRACSLAPSC